MLIPDTLLICALVLMWGASLVGLGLVITPFGRSSTPGTIGTLGDSGLLGLLALSLFSCIVNFFVPLGGWASAIILLSGWVCLILRWRLACSAWGYAPRLPLAALLAFAVPALAILLVGPKFLHSYDTGLYHLQTISTAQNSPIVLGLANLHSRFGYNSLWLVASAGLSLPLIPTQSMFIANILIAIFSLMAIYQRMARSFKNKDAGCFASRIYGIGSAILCPAIVMLLPVHSPNTDLAPALLVIEIFYVALAVIESSNDPTRRAYSSAELALVIMFSVFAITLKTSQLMILLVPITLIATAFLGGLAVTWRPIVQAGIFSAILLLVWDLRGIGLSGCILYPSSATCLTHLPWSVTPDSAVRELAWIKAWARNPGSDPERTLSNWQWLRPWGLHMLRNPLAWLIGATAMLAASMGILSSILSRRDSPALEPPLSNMLRLYLSMFVCSAIGVCFWFVSSPDVRFAAGFLIAFPLIGLALIFRLSIGGASHQPLPKSLVTLTSYLLRRPATSALVIASLTIFGGEVYYRKGTVSTWPTTPRGAVVERKTFEGKTIYVPSSGDQCWDAQRPCTPYFDPSLHFTNFGRWQMITHGVTTDRK